MQARYPRDMGYRIRFKLRRDSCMQAADWSPLVHDGADLDGSGAEVPATGPSERQRRAQVRAATQLALHLAGGSRSSRNGGHCGDPARLVAPGVPLAVPVMALVLTVIIADTIRHARVRSTTPAQPGSGGQWPRCLCMAQSPSAMPDTAP